MKHLRKMTRVVTAATLLASVSATYACWFNYSAVCIPNGAFLGAVTLASCPGYSTHAYAYGTIYKPDTVAAGGVGQGYEGRNLNINYTCNGTAKVYNNCSHSYDYIPYSSSGNVSSSVDTTSQKCSN